MKKRWSDKKFTCKCSKVVNIGDVCYVCKCCDMVLCYGCGEMAHLVAQLSDDEDFLKWTADDVI